MHLICLVESLCLPLFCLHINKHNSLLQSCHYSVMCFDTRLLEEIWSHTHSRFLVSRICGSCNLHTIKWLHGYHSYCLYTNSIAAVSSIVLHSLIGGLCCYADVIRSRYTLLTHTIHACTGHTKKNKSKFVNSPSSCDSYTDCIGLKHLLS